MEEFLIYLELGFDHIADLKACDHLLFVLTLCAPFKPAAWRQILILVTAFTIGHSLTLAAAALGWIVIPSALIELLIPVTILITALSNVLLPQSPVQGFVNAASLSRYVFALGFGLIHGLGFSNFFRALMGESGSIVWPLFSFNVGIELGQALIVGVFFLSLLLIGRIRPVVHRDWNLFFSGAGAGGAVLLLLNQFAAE